MSKPLNGMKEIKAAFGVSACTVRKWIAEGAPVIVHYADKNNATRVYDPGNKCNGVRYSADYDRLYDWLLKKQEAAKPRQGFWA